MIDIIVVFSYCVIPAVFLISKEYEMRYKREWEMSMHLPTRRYILFKDMSVGLTAIQKKTLVNIMSQSPQGIFAGKYAHTCSDIIEKKIRNEV